MTEPHGKETLQPVILAGGSGTRLRPRSRSLYPKQFLPLTGDTPLFTQTLRRLDALGRSSRARAPPLEDCTGPSVNPQAAASRGSRISEVRRSCAYW